MTVKDKMKLSFKDFDKRDGYVSWRGKKIEICFEPCFNGCDVAVYDLNQNLLVPKYCTDIKNWPMKMPTNGIKDMLKIAEMRKRAIIKANEFYEKHEK